MKPTLPLLLGLSMILVISRLVPHAPNFTATLATFIFTAMVLRKNLFWLILIVAYWISDLALNNIVYANSQFKWFTSGFEYLVLLYAIIFYFLIKMSKKELQPIQVFFTTIGCSFFFFIFSNLLVWLNSAFYAKDLTGLISCYVAAIPFFGNEVAGTLFYSSILFSAYWLFSPNLQTSEVRK